VGWPVSGDRRRRRYVHLADDGDDVAGRDVVGEGEEENLMRGYAGLRVLGVKGSLEEVRPIGASPKMGTMRLATASPVEARKQT
jgi:hypothetical protein